MIPSLQSWINEFGVMDICYVSIDSESVRVCADYQSHINDVVVMQLATSKSREAINSLAPRRTPGRIVTLLSLAWRFLSIREQFWDD